MVCFQTGWLASRSARFRLESQSLLAWLSAVMASLTWLRRCRSVSTAPSLVSAMAYSPVSGCSCAV